MVMIVHHMGLKGITSSSRSMFRLNQFAVCLSDQFRSFVTPQQNSNLVIFETSSLIWVMRCGWWSVGVMISWGDDQWVMISCGLWSVGVMISCGMRCDSYRHTPLNILCAQFPRICYQGLLLYLVCYCHAPPFGIYYRACVLLLLGLVTIPVKTFLSS